MSQDPYAPPREELAESGGPVGEVTALREIVVAWEKLRISYNLLLLVPGITIGWVWVARQEMPMVVAVLGAFVVGIGANLAFFLGPLAELYCRALLFGGQPLGRGRLFIYGAGLAVSFAVFGLALLGGFS